MRDGIDHQVSNSIGERRIYSTFISYRHADNRDEGRRWAEWLHEALETYEVPHDLVGRRNDRGAPIPSSLYPVFRDEVELPANAQLSRRIREALENSATLIVVCSPRAVESRFIADEIRIFKELGKADRILALIVDGEPNADDLAKMATGLSAEAECFPEPLRFGLPHPASVKDGAVADGEDPQSIDWTVRTDPIAADVRPGGRPEQGWTGANFYRAALERTDSWSAAECRRLQKEYATRLELARLKLIAGILGIALGRLTKRDAVYRARKLRRLALIFGVLAALAVAGGGVAMWQRSRAETARLSAEAAERNTRLRASKADADVALALSQRGDDANAFAHAVRSLELNGQNRLAAVLAYRLLTDGRLVLPARVLTHDIIVTALAFSPDGNFLATGCDDGAVFVSQLTTGTRWALIPPLKRRIQRLAFSPDNRALAIGTDQEIVAWAFEGSVPPTLITHEFAYDVLDLAWPIDDRIVTYTGRDWGSDYDMTQVFVYKEGRWRLVFAIGDDLGLPNAELADDSEASLVEARGFQTWVAHKTGMLVIHDDDRLVWLNLRGVLDIEKPAFAAKLGKDAEVAVATENGLAVVSSNFVGNGDSHGAKSRQARAAEKFSLKWIDPRNGKNGSLQMPEGLSFDEVSADGELLLCSSERGSGLVERRSGKLLVEHFWRLEGQFDRLAMRRDGLSWILRPRRTDPQSSVEVATVFNRANLRETNLSLPAGILSASFDAQGEQVAVATADRNVRVWPRTAIEAPVFGLHPAEPEEKDTDAAEPPSALYELEESEQTIFRRDPNTQQTAFVAKLQDPGVETYSITGHSFSADGRRLALSYGSWSDRPDNNVPSVAVLYETANGQMIGKPLQHEDDVFSPRFSPDGSWVVTACDDGTVRRWRADNGAAAGPPLRLPDRVRYISFSSDGSLLITGTGHIIDTEKWVIRQTLTPGTRMIGRNEYGNRIPLAEAYFSSDGVWLATASEPSHKTGDENQDVEYVHLNQWELQSGLRIGQPIAARAGNIRISEGPPQPQPGPRTWTCTFPAEARRLLPLLKACSPLMLNDNGEKVINPACATSTVNPETVFPEGRTTGNQAEYDFATLVLKHPADALSATGAPPSTAHPASSVVIAPSPIVMPENLAASEAQADQRLNETYSALRKSVANSEKERLKREQIQWLRTRDAIADRKARLEFVRERSGEFERRVEKAR